MSWSTAPSCVLGHHGCAMLQGWPGWERGTAEPQETLKKARRTLLLGHISIGGPSAGKGKTPPTPPDLLDHDAVGPRQLEPPCEVQCVHPAQDQREDHDSQVCLDAAQVQPRRDDHQHRVDEAGGELGSDPALTASTSCCPSQNWGCCGSGATGGSPHTRVAGRSHL